MTCHQKNTDFRNSKPKKHSDDPCLYIHIYMPISPPGPISFISANFTGTIMLSFGCMSLVICATIFAAIHWQLHISASTGQF